jgi:hypothetical protein
MTFYIPAEIYPFSFINPATWFGFVTQYYPLGSWGSSTSLTIGLSGDMEIHSERL